MRDYAINFGIAFAASLFFTYLVRGAARRFGFVAKPRADRWHKKPTALYGGVGIFLAFALTFVLRRPSELQGETLLLACATGMFLTGLVDDYVQLKPYAKLVAQIVCAATLSIGGLRLHWLSSPVFDQALTIFWLVGITNALNLLDNLDGLAGGIAAIAAGFLIYFCHASGNPLVAGLAAAFCGAVAGFLVFNFNPASIFMGDCGSLFLGFFLSGVTMVNNQGGMRRNVIAVLAIPVLLLMVPIIDTTLVTIARKYHGRPVSQGGRDHTSHRLVALGFSERSAALILWGFAAASGLVAIAVHNLSVAIGVLLVPVFALVLLAFLIAVGRVKVYKPVDNPQEGGGRALLPTLAEFAYKRRVFEVLHDLLAIVIAAYASFLLRFEGATVAPYFDRFVGLLPPLIATQMTAFLLLGLYRGMWRYTSIGDLPGLLKAVLGGWVASVVVVAFLTRFVNVSRAALMLDAILLVLLVAGSRVTLRMIHTEIARRRPRTDARRVLIYGAGDGGELLVRELLRNQDLGLVPVGFLDDDQAKHGRVIHGVRVLGPGEMLRDAVKVESVSEVVVSTGLLESARLERIEALCRELGLTSRRMRIAFE